MNQSSSIRTAVLMGGLSAERTISLKTGKAVLAALKAAGHDVVGLDVGRDLPARLIEERIDRCFVALHGRYGEDGCVQGALELMGIPYTGSPVRACAVTMDKITTKRLLRDLGVPVADSFVIRPQDDVVLPPFGLPAVVKAPLEGSSIGVFFAEDEVGYREAVSACRGRGSEVLVEPRVVGREVTVGLLLGQALPVVEVAPREGWFDFKNKYTSGQTEYRVPAPIDPALAERLQGYAERAWAALGLAGMARMDFILPVDGDPVALEVNAIPGLTATSLVPMAAAHRGIDFGTLVERLLDSARVHNAVDGATAA